MLAPRDANADGDSACPSWAWPGSTTVAAGGPIQSSKYGMTARAPDLSIVVPAYNEVDRLPKALDSVFGYAAQRGLDVEVIVVSDGSVDGTAELVEATMTHQRNLRLVRLLRNQGKGAAVREGVLRSCGRVVAYVDADLAAPIEQLDLLREDLADAKVAVVSRALPGAQLQRRQSRARELAGKAYAFLVQILLVRGVPDAQCGLKAFDGEFARLLFANVRETGGIFDTEVVLIATKMGGRISQRPAVWSHDPDTRDAYNLRKSIGVGIGLARLKIRHRILLPLRVRGTIHRDER